jgi:hypothetical protein
MADVLEPITASPRSIVWIDLRLRLPPCDGPCGGCVNGGGVNSVVWIVVVWMVVVWMVWCGWCGVDSGSVDNGTAVVVYREATSRLQGGEETSEDVALGDLKSKLWGGAA